MAGELSGWLRPDYGWLGFFASLLYVKLTDMLAGYICYSAQCMATLHMFENVSAVLLYLAK